MSLIVQIGLTVSIIANTISIVILARRNSILHANILCLEAAMAMQKVLLTAIRIQNSAVMRSMGHGVEVSEEAPLHH